jgi:sugar lactone lactonase YvrE
VISGIDCLTEARDRCGEGVVWHENESAIYWTDVNRFLIRRLDTCSHLLKEWQFDEPVVALSLTTDPRTLLVALGSRLLLWRPCVDSREDLGFAIEGWPQVRLNDGRTDPCGNFWVGSMRNNVNPDGSSIAAGGTDGKLYRIAPGGDTSVWREAVGIANTLCWSPDGKTFYFGDSLANTLYRYDFNTEHGSIANGQSFFAGFKRGIPDGSSIDSEGFLWNCRYGGGCIVRIDPDGGVDCVIEMPTANPTTCTFGGKDLRKLYVTTAEAPSDPAARFAGSLFEVSTQVPGLPQRKFLLR